MKKALVLAGGAPQIKLIELLHARGYYVILTDYFEWPVARDFADKVYRESTLDIDAVREIAVKEQVDLITTCCTDQALLTVAQVSEELDLPCYIDSVTGRLVTDKSYMKHVFAKNGIPTAPFVILEACDALPKVVFPSVVKPVDCNSSKGVVKVLDEDGLSEAVANACVLSRTGKAIVEEFIEGEELSVDCFIENGAAHVICVSRNDKVADRDHFVIRRGYCSPETMTEKSDDLEAIAQRIANAFNLAEGPMLIQLLKRENELFVIEFSARTGGCSKYRMIELATGVDMIASMLDITLGGFSGLELAKGPKYVIDEFVYCYPGEFSHLEGFEECLSSGVIADYLLLKTPGSKFDKVESSGDRVAALVYVAETEDEYRTKHDIAMDKLAVRSIDGSDIMRKDLLVF